MNIGKVALALTSAAVFTATGCSYVTGPATAQGHLSADQQSTALLGPGDKCTEDMACWSPDVFDGYTKTRNGITCKWVSADQRWTIVGSHKPCPYGV